MVVVVNCAVVETLLLLLFVFVFDIIVLGGVVDKVGVLVVFIVLL